MKKLYLALILILGAQSTQPLIAMVLHHKSTQEIRLIIEKAISKAKNIILKSQLTFSADDINIIKQALQEYAKNYYHFEGRPQPLPSSIAMLSNQATRIFNAVKDDYVILQGQSISPSSLATKNTMGTTIVMSAQEVFLTQLEALLTETITNGA